MPVRVRHEWIKWSLLALPLWPMIVVLLVAQRAGLAWVNDQSIYLVEALAWYAFQWGPWALLSPALFWWLLHKPLRASALQVHVPWIALGGGVFLVFHTALQALIKHGFYDEFASRPLMYAFQYLFLAKAHLEVLVYALVAAVAYLVRFAVRSDRHEQCGHSGVGPDCLVSRRLGRLRLIPWAQIESLHVNERQLYAMVAGEAVPVSCNLNQALTRLPAPPFVRASRSAALNLDYVVEVEELFNHTAEARMRSGHRVKVSRRAYRQLCKLVGGQGAPVRS